VVEVGVAVELFVYYLAILSFFIMGIGGESGAEGEVGFLGAIVLL
jgi:hypothetical protein